ncbi:MAG: DUF1592 domain-containing protein [Verrucomicrobiota bacterium]
MFRRSHFRNLCCFIALLILCGVCALSLPAAKTPVARQDKMSAAHGRNFEKDIKPLLAKYCYACHGETKKKADLSLQSYDTLAAVLKDRATWEKVLHNLQTGEMPPENKPQPSLRERELITKWLEADIFHCDCDRPDPGRVTIRRLNRTEYNNTIRDLLGVDFHPANDFPADDTGYGFDNNGDVLSLPPILLEKYMAAAEKILAQAVVTDFSTNGFTNRFEAEKMQSTFRRGIYRNTFFKLPMEGEVFTRFTFPREGNYIIRVRAFGEQAGDELPKMELQIGGEIVKTFAVEALEKSPAIYEWKFKTGAGIKKVSVGYINNFTDKQAENPARRDRNLIIDYVEICGPFGPPQIPQAHRQIFSRPVPPSAAAQRAYARDIINHFARRAFRRPVTAAESNRLLAFFDLVQSEGENFQSGVRLALQAVLVSPHFLFRGETQARPDDEKSIFPIDEFALASRLSYFLWSSTPDEELLRLAERGRLRKNLDAQVRRMLLDQKSSAFAENFAGQWLQIRNLKFIAPDSENFPAFDEELRVSMQKETELFFASLLRENHSALDLLKADYTFLNEKLARLYDIPGVEGNEFRRVSLKGTARAGILTQASILTLTSNPTRTSPVKRGKWVLENILGTPPPPPPPDVPELKEGKALSGTLRQRMEQHRANPNCAACHARMDPIGFAFEHFDGIGAWRKTDGDSPIDTKGVLISGETFADAAELRQILVGEKKEEFVRCLAGKLLTYALGRGMEMYDRCAIDEIYKSAAKDGFRFNDLIFAVVKSVPFQKQRGDEHSPEKKETASR